MNYVAGVTPIESAFEVIGLTNSLRLTEYLFVDKPWGMIAFAIGFYISLSKYLYTKDFRVMIKFMLIAFFTLVLFVVPQTQISNVSSTMEKMGNFTEVTADEILTSDTKSKKVQSVVLFVSQMFNSITLGAVQVIDDMVGDDKFNYLKSPFLANKISLATMRFLDSDIKDYKLKEDLDKFIRNHYLTTLAKIEENGTLNSDNSVYYWPGNPTIMSNYSSSQKEQWTNIYNNLKKYVENNFEYYQTYLKYNSETKKFINKSADAYTLTQQEILVISLINNDIYDKRLDYNPIFRAKSSNPFVVLYESIVSSLSRLIVWAGNFLSSFFSEIALRWVIKHQPYIQGYSILTLYSLFPVTLIFILFRGDLNPLWDFFKYVFYIKSWTIIFAIINAANKSLITIQAKLSPSTQFYYEDPAFNVITCIFIISTPILAYIFVTGSISSFGSLTSMALGYGSQSLSPVKKIGDKFSKKIMKKKV